MKRRERKHIAKIIVILVGVILFITGMYQIKKRKKFLETGEEIEAEVFDYQSQMDDTWSYVYMYTPPGSNQIIAQDNVYYSNKQRRRKKILLQAILFVAFVIPLFA
jgi:uncharacterized membrane protein